MCVECVIGGSCIYILFKYVVCNIVVFVLVFVIVMVVDVIVFEVLFFFLGVGV